MPDTRMLLTLISDWETTAPEARQDASPLQRQLRWLTIGAVVIVCSGAGLALFQLWDSWHRAQWGDFWGAVAVLFGSLGAPAAIRLEWRIYVARRDEASGVRRAAIAGDDRLAPLAAEQPEPLSSADLALAPTRLGPLYARDRGRAGGVLGLGIILLALGLASAGGLLYLMFGLTIDGVPAADSMPVEIWILFGVALVVMALVGLLGGYFIVSAWRARRPIAVEADALGLRWRASRREGERRMEWHAAQAFYTIALPTSTPRGQSALYVLDAGETMLLWRVRARAWASARERAAHAGFASLIAARTRLPLRDLTAALDEVVTDQEYREATFVEALAEHMSKAPVDVAAETTNSTQRPWIVRVAMRSFWVFTLLLALAGLILPHIPPP